MREPKPIKRLEISEKNQTLRIIAAVLLLVIGAVGITVGFMKLLNKETGWQHVQVVTQERSCAEQFYFQYHFSGNSAEVKVLSQKLQQIYGEGCVKAYQLFTPDEEIQGVNNIYYVNRHPNEVITVDPVLYSAFEKLENTPYLYLGPVYTHYYSLIYNTDDAYVQDLDPACSAEAKVYVSRIAEFAADRSDIQLELLGDYQIKLHVSEDYLAFAQEEEIDTFLDFAYMTNGFIIDYLADLLIAQNMTRGYLASADGYTRNLSSEEIFSFNIFDRVENTIYPAAVMNYQGPISMVFLKDYSAAASDTNYRDSGDRVVHLLADPADGMYRTSLHNLVSYSYDMGCADVLLQMLPVFVTEDSFTPPQNVFSVWCEQKTIHYQDESISFHSLLSEPEVQYTVKLEKE